MPRSNPVLAIELGEDEHNRLVVVIAIEHASIIERDGELLPSCSLDREMVATLIGKLAELAEQMV